MAKYKRAKNRRSIPVPFVVLGIGLLFLGLAAVFLLSNGGNESGTPILSVDQQRIEMGDLKVDTPVSFIITVKNTGDGTLRFTEPPFIEVVEGCWPPKLTIGSMVLKPGETTTIDSGTFSMHAGMEGPHNFAVNILTNDPTHSELVVNVLQNWIP